MRDSKREEEPPFLKKERKPSMAPFPCSSESTAASALLLLTVTPQPNKRGLDDGGESSAARSDLGKRVRTDFGDQSFVSGDSKSCCTSLIAGSSDEDQARRIRMIALAALHRDVKLKAAQKNLRSKMKSGVKFTTRRTASGVKVATTTSFPSTSSESSCLSTSSSAIHSSARSRRCREPKPAWSWWSRQLATEHCTSRKMVKKSRKVGSANMRRKADAILQLLSQGCFSEVKIRQTLGDSPDTSKALRLLLKFEEVKRTGAGGRRSPYIYTIA